MSTYGHNVKRALLSALFFSSCSSSGHIWKEETIKASNPSICNICYLEPVNPFHNLELEIQNRENSKEIYLNIYGIPLTATKNRNFPVEVTIDQKSTIYEAYLFEGNQRLLLPSCAQEKILDALNRKAEISLSAGSYHATIIYEGYHPIL